MNNVLAKMLPLADEMDECMLIFSVVFIVFVKKLIARILKAVLMAKENKGK